MENIDVYSVGILNDVYYRVDEQCAGAITEIIFIFEEVVLRITVNTEDDTICLSTVESDIDIADSTIRNKQFDELIASFKSKSIQWAWKLTNQQGYFDGVQFEFTDKIASVENDIVVQFIAIASAIQVYLVKKIV
jgi:hypothetical protein